MKSSKVYAFAIMAIMLTIAITLLSNNLYTKTTKSTNETVTISGIVSDSNGNSVQGVSVKLVNDKTETFTNSEGFYTIVARSGDKIEYSYLGYKTQIHRITKTETINITLQVDSQILTESVVIDSEEIASNKWYTQPPIVSNTASYARINGKSTSDYSYSKKYEYTHDYTYGNEEYTSYKENKFISPLDEALSTFSIDVDGASYSNLRRMINNGQTPDKDAIRTEEFVNYFSYNYQEPTKQDPIKITTEIGECPWNKEHRLFRIGLKAKEIESGNLPASNFVFLIDVSGSMYGPTRLDLVKSSMKLLVNNLREKDRVAIVTYASNAGLALPSTSGSNKQAIEEALDNLTSGGSTAGGGGIKLAYKIAKENFIKEGNNRIILCTDGDFNVGVSSNEGLENLIENERKSGVFLSVLGYGMGNYKDSKMQILAEKGNGNAAYIDNLQEANRVLVEQFGGTLFTVAKDVKLQIEFNPDKVQAYRLVGYESRLLNKEDFNDDTKDAGEIGAGHTVTAFYEIVPQGVSFSKMPNVDALKYQKIEKPKELIKLSNDLCTVKLRYKQPDSDKSIKLELPVIDTEKNNVSSDMKFASAVAMFAQLLKDSEYKGSATYDSVINLAKQGLDNDDNGYRREFIRLVNTTKGLK